MIPMDREKIAKKRNKRIEALDIKLNMLIMQSMQIEQRIRRVKYEKMVEKLRLNAKTRKVIP